MNKLKRNKIMYHSIQPNMIPMRDIKQFSDGDLLFYVD